MRQPSASLCFLFLLVLLLVGSPADTRAADDAVLQRMALCQDSWLDWKEDPVKSEGYVRAVESRYTMSARGPAFTPKAPAEVAGLRVRQLFPQNVGMALGVSVIVDATLAQTRAAVEERLGKKMQCERAEEGEGCELKVGHRRTVVLMSDNGGPARHTMLGCFYYYQQ